MSSTEPLQASPVDRRRDIERWLGNYSHDHRHPTNIALHHVCVPLIVWSLVAALWAVPVPAGIGQQGLWAGLAMVGVLGYYLRLSRALAAAMFAVFAVLAAISHAIWLAAGAESLLWSAAAVFALAWAGQYIGHHIEGKRPSFYTDLAYLLIGPLWMVTKALRRFGVRY